MAKDETTETKDGPPKAEADFAALMVEYGVNEKKAQTIVKYISETGTVDVFSDIKQLMGKLAHFPRDVSPVNRATILEHWAALTKIQYPEELKKEAEASAGEPGPKTTPKPGEKYSVDKDTGDMTVASKDEPYPLNYDEAEKLSIKIKKEIEARKKAEAKEAKGDQEPPFTLDVNGDWQLNPKAKIGMTEVLAYESLKKAKEKGEPADPFEILKKQAADMERMRLIFGGGEAGAGLFKSVDDFVKLKSLFGGDEETKTLLAGIYKQLKEGGGPKGDSEEVGKLRKELKELSDSIKDQDKKNLETQLTAVRTELTTIKGELAKEKEGKAGVNEYTIMTKAIDLADRRLGAIEGLIRGKLGSPPRQFGADEKKELTEAIESEIVNEDAVDTLAQKVLFSQEK